MKTATFKEWDLDTLDEAFTLRQVWESELLNQWENNEQQLNDFEKQTLKNLQKSLIRGGRAWNETELENKFISPVMMTAGIDDEQIGYFLERPLKGVIGDYELSGVVDGMIATGIRNPHMPYFCMHEYKRSVENQGTPDAQVLAAMLVAKEMNANKLPIYGLFVVGLVWNFIVLKDNEYCISKNYNADAEEIFTIFKMLKTLKQIVKSEVNDNEPFA
ncbi:MAG: hypothetical protein GQ569_12710 [Methylococcaceae bacterium]|nr:hypothetical protein [Methylococcaceae bacterium]